MLPWLLSVLACGSLLPEHVAALPGGVEAERMDGPPGFGTAMAWVDGELAVAGGGVVRWGEAEWSVPQVRGLWAGPHGPRVATGDQVLDLVSGEVLFTGELRAAHGAGTRVVVASESGLVVDGVLQAMDGLRRVQVGEGGVLLLRCVDERCWVELEGEELGPSSLGAALAWQGSRALWGQPELDQELGQGAIWDVGGLLLEGRPGEHLGQGLCADFAAGEHNLHARPNQSRVRSVGGGGELAIASGPEGGAISLACDAATVAVAQPTWLEGGRVWIVDRELLPSGP